jgi:serine/threonine protein kinase
MQSDALHPGTVVADRWKIVRIIDSGGMGSVYEVSTGGLSFGMKLMNPRLVHDADFRARFDLEIRIGTALNNPNVVKVFEHGVDHRFGPYLVMELLRGETLDSHIHRVGRLAVPYARELLAQLCNALGSAHVAGIVHRDLKPGNVFLNEPGPVVKVLDFGIAKVIGHALAANSAVLGTAGWMAPEQFNTRQPVGPPTDVWAIGLLAFQMLTGKPFWRSDPMSWNDLSMEICSLSLPLASSRAAELGAEGSLPDGFDSWFQRCVNRDLNARFPNGRVAYEELKPLMRIKLVNPTPSPSPVRASPRASAPELDPDEQEIQAAVSALQSRIEITLWSFRASSQPPVIAIPPTDPHRPAPGVRASQPPRVSVATPVPSQSLLGAPPQKIIGGTPNPLPVQAPVSYPPVPARLTGLPVAAAASFLVMALLVLLVLIGLAVSRSPGPELTPELAPPEPAALWSRSSTRGGG